MWHATLYHGVVMFAARRGRPGSPAAGPDWKDDHMITRIAPLLLAALIAAVPAPAADRPRDFGMRWVRANPFTLMALTQRPAAVADERYAEAGLNTMLAWKRWEKLADAAGRMGIPYHCHLSKGLLGGPLLGAERGRFENMTAEEKIVQLEATRPDPLGDALRAQFQRLCETHDGCTGFVVWDEPKRSSMWTAAKVVTWLKRTFPDALVYGNAYPGGGSVGKYFGGRWVSSGVYAEPSIPYSYEEYLRDFIRIMKADLLMVDIYPYRLPPEGIEADFIHRRYFNCLAQVRRVGLEMNVPYWIFVQSFGKERYTRYPSESDLRMQVFCSLAHGFTGIGYFTYDHVFDGALLQGEDEHRSTPLYHDVIRLNREVANLGRTMRFLTSTDVRYLAGRRQVDGRSEANPPPEGSDPFEPDGLLREIVIRGQGPHHNVLIGRFTDDAGARYFMPVNLVRGPGLRAADATLDVRIRLDPAVTRISRLSRETGAAERLVVTGGELALTLPGGTGDLFRIEPGPFPGGDDGG